MSDVSAIGATNGTAVVGKGGGTTTGRAGPPIVSNTGTTKR